MKYLIIVSKINKAMYSNIKNQNHLYYPTLTMVDHTPSNLDLSCQPLQNFYNINDIRLEKFKKVAGKYEIKPEYCLKLRQLEGFEIVLLCDDSGSMSTIIDDKNPFGIKMSRWDELKNIVDATMEIATSLDRNGIDIYFLNREPVYNVNDSLLVHPILTSLSQMDFYHQ